MKVASNCRSVKNTPWIDLRSSPATMNSICFRSRAVQVALKLMSSSSGGASGHRY
jgi:hypothetical protein